ncbi:MAG: discoidin domain-containing protein [Bacteroidales bacterium]|jgi:hypothetical protein|nr:discoidin domain-containing protein [Bacteroidales bacterium]
MKKVLLSVFILFFLFFNTFGQELISRGKPVTASRTYNPGSPKFVNDGDIETAWNAGAHAPQWIQIDLQNNYDISSIKLIPETDRRGNTVQKIFVSEDLKDWKEIDRFEEELVARKAVIRNYTNLLNIRGVKIETVSSPTWIAWREIEIFGTLAEGGTHSNQNSVNIYESIKKIDCYTQIKPEVFAFPDKDLAFVKISENVFSLISTQDLQEKNIFNFKEKGIISLSNSYIEGNHILLAINNGKGEIKEYIKYNLSNFSFENIKCKNTPRGCIITTASSYYVSLRNDTPYDFGNYKVFFRSKGRQYFYDISKIITEKADFNNAMSGNRNDKLDFLKKYPNSEYKDEVIASFINSFTTIKNISDFIKINKEFNSQLDEKAFTLVKNSNSELELQEYISAFPEGKYLTDVNMKIAAIKQAKVEDERRIAAEKQKKEDEARLAERRRQEADARRIQEIKNAQIGDKLLYSETWSWSSGFWVFKTSGAYTMMVTCFIEHIDGVRYQLRVGDVQSSDSNRYETPTINGVRVKKGDIIWARPLNGNQWVYGESY